MTFKPISIKDNRGTAYETDTGLACVVTKNRMACSVSSSIEGYWPGIVELLEIADKLLQSDSGFLFYLEQTEELKVINIIKR